jgi:hypothetical protein
VGLTLLPVQHCARHLPFSFDQETPLKREERPSDIARGATTLVSPTLSLSWTACHRNRTSANKYNFQEEVVLNHHAGGV